MLRRTFITSLLLTGLLSASISHADDTQVQIQAHLQPLTDTTADLVVTASISDGLHIYAQTQPKPFLATRINVTPDESILSVGSFTPSTPPVKHRHPQLDVELHEHAGIVQWRTTVTFSRVTTDSVVNGTLFAQACEEGRCFAPQTYSFNARLTKAIPATADHSAPEPSAVFDVSLVNQPDSMEPAAATAAAASFDIDHLQVQSESTASSVWVILPLAFVAGLLLNFMPCVLPVVGLKLLSFVQQAESDRRRILLMNLSYTAGLLSVMLVLATLAVFTGLGWGEQFSSTGFTVTLSAIVFAFGLSFLGVWEIPLPGFMSTVGGTSRQEGYGGAFSKGILSTLLATPCSGPFLGAALAWAVTQPAALTYTVFVVVGLGMASPYLAAGLFPSVVRFLPKPGNWMVTFKQIMGFIMLGTVVYLMSFMAIAAVVPTILLLLGLGVALWHAGHTSIAAPRRTQLQAWTVALLITTITAWTSFGWLQGVMQERFERSAQRLLAAANNGADDLVVSGAEDDEIQWVRYSPERLESLVRSGTPVFVDFTADWCLTCKANEAAAVDTPEFGSALRRHGVVALRADKTMANPDADALLRSLGNAAASIPFYAFFSADHPEQPVTLDGVFTSPEPFVSTLEQQSIAGSSAEMVNVPRQGERLIPIRAASMVR